VLVPSVLVSLVSVPVLVLPPSVDNTPEVEPTTV
jgi:hypothetical protein